MHKATWVVALTLGVSLALAGGPAGAVVDCPWYPPGDPVRCFIPPGDLDGYGLDVTGVNPPFPFATLSSTFMGGSPALLTGNVWQQLDGSYLYALTLNPNGVASISQFGTEFSVQGISTTDGAAGYSYNDVKNATADTTLDASKAWDIEYDTVSGLLTWYRGSVVGSDFWDANHQDPITFYFTSLYPPGENQNYSFINAGPDDSSNQAPGASVPEPSSLVLLGSGLLAFGFVRRSFRHIRE